MTRLIVLGVLLLIGTFSGMSQQHTTLAFLSTSVQSTQNQFSAGTLHIADNLASGATLSMSNLLAGDNFDAELDISNSGSLALTYAMTTTYSGNSTLASTLQLTIRTKTSNPCSSRDGTALYSGSLASAAIGDPAHGVQAGDRQLAAAASEPLCFTIVLPASAGPSLQATNVAPTFVFSAEQS